MSDFIPGLELGRQYYGEIVRPLVDAEFPGLPHSAALIGSGSEILGFDTEMSSDHDWGPRVLLFLEETDHARCHTALHDLLALKLPQTFRGYQTDFAYPETDHTYPLQHRVRILTLRGFVQDYLGFDIAHPLQPADWLTFPQQKLRTLVAGAIYRDQVGLRALWEKFTYYPDDVWFYLLAASWNRIGQENHLMGRAGYVGDEIGSAIIGSRLVRDLMLLCFLMERQYAPYPKWFGTAFAQLSCAPELSPTLFQAQIAPTWQERERPLCTTYTYALAKHNALGITPPVSTQVTPFYDRPFQVIMVEEVIASLRTRIQDPTVKHLADQRLLGSIDQFSDSTDLLSDSSLRTQLRTLYEK